MLSTNFIFFNKHLLYVLLAHFGHLSLMGNTYLLQFSRFFVYFFLNKHQIDIYKFSLAPCNIFDRL